MCIPSALERFVFFAYPSVGRFVPRRVGNTPRARERAALDDSRDFARAFDSTRRDETR